MPKFGLSQQDKKYIEFQPFAKELEPAGLFYNQGKSFYRVFRAAFGNGSICVIDNLGDKHIIPTDNISACLVNYHFSIELLLKSLICLKTKLLDKSLKTGKKGHNLVLLLENAQIIYPNLKEKITENHRLILQTLSEFFSELRYLEGSLCMSLNKKEESLTPNAELSILLDEIYNLLVTTFDKNK